MKFKKSISLTIILIGFTACLNKSDGCIADSITEMQKVIIDNRSYTLVLRTSGLQDKINFYELYENSPIFDVCGRATVNSVANTIIAEYENVSKLIVKDHSLQIVYSKNEASITDFSRVPVEIK